MSQVEEFEGTLCSVFCRVPEVSGVILTCVETKTFNIHHTLM